GYVPVSAVADALPEYVTADSIEQDRCHPAAGAPTDVYEDHRPYKWSSPDVSKAFSDIGKEPGLGSFDRLFAAADWRDRRSLSRHRTSQLRGFGRRLYCLPRSRRRNRQNEHRRSNERQRIHDKRGV